VPRVRTDLETQSTDSAFSQLRIFRNEGPSDGAFSSSQRKLCEVLPVIALPLHQNARVARISFLAESLGALPAPDRPRDRNNRSSLTKFALRYQSM
jgi:hypothetical protein